MSTAVMKKSYKRLMALLIGHLHGLLAALSGWIKISTWTPLPFSSTYRNQKPQSNFISNPQRIPVRSVHQTHPLSRPSSFPQRYRFACNRVCMVQ